MHISLCTSKEADMLGSLHWAATQGSEHFIMCVILLERGSCILQNSYAASGVEIGKPVHPRATVGRFVIAFIIRVNCHLLPG